MRKLHMVFIALLLLLLLLLATACSSKDDDFNPDGQTSDNIQYDGNRKILVAYFSATGNTQRLAEQIVSATSADVFRIEAAEPYASNHMMTAIAYRTSRSTTYAPRLPCCPTM